MPFLMAAAGPAWPLEGTPKSGAAALPAVSTRAAPGGPDPAGARTPAAGVSTDDRRRALLLMDLLIEEGRLEEAEAFLAGRFESDPETRPWTLRLARQRAAQEDHGEAAQAYRQLVEDSPDDPGLLLEWGRQAYSAGDRGSARQAFERAAAVSRDPEAPFYLAEMAWSEGRGAEGRSWAEAALAALARPANPRESRMSLRLRSRTRWSDALHDEFGRLFDHRPQDPETLVEWAGILTGAGLPAEAAEPSALLAERFPGQGAKWRLIEADRLRRLGDERSLEAHLADSLLRMPDDPALNFAMGELNLQDRRWACAEARLERSLPHRGFERASEDYLVEARRQGRPAAGPSLRWRESDSASAAETGAAYAGYPRPGLKLEAEALRGRYRVKSRGEDYLLSGAWASAALERGPWTAGADADLRFGSGTSAASPGAFARWKGREGWSWSARAALRRAWRDSTEAVAAGALTDEFAASAQTRPFPRLYVGAQAHLDRASVRGGGSALQTAYAPEAVWTLLDRPFYAGAGYRFVGISAAGDASFFARLPLLGRARTHYMVASFGKRWLAGRLRADGYVYNGHEPERGRRFGRADLVGYGLNAEWIRDGLRATASYEFSREDVEGVGGRSHGLRLALHWAWHGLPCRETAPPRNVPRESP